MQIFKEDFETGTTTMTIQQDRGEVVVSSENPIVGVYSARCRSFFDSAVGWKWTYGIVTKTVSLSQLIAETSIRVDEYNRAGQRMLGVEGSRAYLLLLGFQSASRTLYIMVNGVGTITFSRVWNLGEVYRVRVYVKCSSGLGIADGAVAVWINDELVYENNAVNNWDASFGLTGRVWAGCRSSWSETSVVQYAEALIDDLIIDDTLPSPTNYTLSVDSSSVTGVRFSLNGIEKITPYNEALAEGSYTIVMPSEVVVGADIYRFVRWNDGNTSVTRTVLLNIDTALVAEYELYVVPPLPTHQLTIDSTPIQGISFTVEKVS